MNLFNTTITTYSYAGYAQPQNALSFCSNACASDPQCKTFSYDTAAGNTTCSFYAVKQHNGLCFQQSTTTTNVFWNSDCSNLPAYNPSIIVQSMIYVTAFSTITSQTPGPTTTVITTSVPAAITFTEVSVMSFTTTSTELATREVVETIVSEIPGSTVTQYISITSRDLVTITQSITVPQLITDTEHLTGVSFVTLTWVSSLPASTITSPLVSRSSITETSLLTSVSCIDIPLDKRLNYYFDNHARGTGTYDDLSSYQYIARPRVLPFDHYTHFCGNDTDHCNGFNNPIN
ncbi:hypothetical protein BDV96DRAFT_308672 [Lophiotrema nucula]|uniref:Apple domain-containing protein n=1 Tax=Lophiotrema nucula TaxID=690887 RepID=A0A6A5YL13_9PLEO|nr:hypothetical protein BDV96DRAFT_308672 [Lophiotrema nucula]